MKNKFGLYDASVGYYGYAVKASHVQLNLVTGQKDTAADILAYALEIMEDPETQSLIASKHGELVGRQAAYAETAQPTVESLATKLNYNNAIGAPLLSLDEEVSNFRNTTSDQVVREVQELVRAPAFLDIRGHANALDAIPPIDVVASMALPAGKGKLNFQSSDRQSRRVPR